MWYSFLLINKQLISFEIACSQPFISCLVNYNRYSICPHKICKSAIVRNRVIYLHSYSICKACNNTKLKFYYTMYTIYLKRTMIQSQTISLISHFFVAHYAYISLPRNKAYSTCTRNFAIIQTQLIHNQPHSQNCAFR